MRRALVLLGLLGLVAAGCGNTTKTVTINVTATSAPPQEKTSLRVYFLKDGRVQPVAREVPKTQAVAGAAMSALARGPTDAEKKLGLTTDIPAGASFDVTPSDVAQGGGGVTLGGPSLSGAALAQAVFTLTQFPAVVAVHVGRLRYGRADFEDETPIIAVESPLPFQHVTSPLRATGTANTFEATFEYELRDPDGRIVASHFVTATSGTGQRGTFDFSVPYQVEREGLGELVVFERSAENGQRIHLSELPVYLEK